MEIFEISMEVFIKIVFASPFIILLLFLLKELLVSIYIEIRYAIKRDKQYLMFAQLKPGDYIWEISNNNIVRHIVKRIEPQFGVYNNKINEVIFSFRDGTNLCIDSNKVKTYKRGKYYTLFKEANAVINFNKLKKQKEIDNIMAVTKEDIMREVKNVTERLTKMQNEI